MSGTRIAGITLDGVVVQPTTTASVADRMRGKSIVHVSDVEPTIVATVAEGTHGESMGDVVQSPGGGMATSSPVREHCTHPPRFLRMVTATQLDCVKDPHSWSWVTDRHSM